MARAAVAVSTLLIAMLVTAQGMRQLQQYGSNYRGSYNQVNNPQASPTTTLSGGNGNRLNGSGGGGNGGNSGNSTANASNNGGDGGGSDSSDSSNTSNAAPVQQAAPASLIRKDLGADNNFGYVSGNFPG